MEHAYRDIWYHGAPPKPLSIVCAMANAPRRISPFVMGSKGSSAALGEISPALHSGLSIDGVSTDTDTQVCALHSSVTR